MLNVAYRSYYATGNWLSFGVLTMGKNEMWHSAPVEFKVKRQSSRSTMTNFICWAGFCSSL